MLLSSSNLYNYNKEHLQKLKCFYSSPEERFYVLILFYFYVLYFIYLQYESHGL